MREYPAVEFVELMSPFKPKGREGVAVWESGLWETGGDGYRIKWVGDARHGLSPCSTCRGMNCLPQVWVPALTHASGQPDREITWPHQGAIPPPPDTGPL